MSPILKFGSTVYLKRPRKYTFKDISVIVEPTVFPPFITISTKFLLQFVENLHLKNKTFLELGCGCGIISILAAKKGAKVTATDINEIALAALSKSIKINRVNISIIKSDLFENLIGQDFDFVIINPPYYPKTPANVAEAAWFCGKDFEYFEALFVQLPNIILAGAIVFMILSEDCEIRKIKNIAGRNKLQCEIIERKLFVEK